MARFSAASWAGARAQNRARIAKRAVHIEDAFIEILLVSLAVGEGWARDPRWAGRSARQIRL
jgi:hypothetical protein